MNKPCLFKNIPWAWGNLYAVISTKLRFLVWQIPF